jgi:hypothetical protein
VNRVVDLRVPAQRGSRNQLCRTEGNSDRRNSGEALQRRRFRPAALPAPRRPAALFSTLPHDHGCRFKPNTDPAALVYPEWQATPHLNINAVYVHFQTARFLKAADGKTPTTSGMGCLPVLSALGPWIWKSWLQFRNWLAGMSGERVEPRLAAMLRPMWRGISRLIGADEEGTLARLRRPPVAARLLR